MGSSPAFVAIVDDEISICRAMLRLLRSAHFQAEAFCSAADFIESLSAHTPDCLVLDLQMPTMTGLELQEHLLRSNKHLPVIIITAHDEPEAAERCLSPRRRALFAQADRGQPTDRFDPQSGRATS